MCGSIGARILTDSIKSPCIDVLRLFERNFHGRVEWSFETAGGVNVKKVNDILRGGKNGE